MRVDVPTLKCDRCGHTTQDINEMGGYQSLTGMYHGYQGSQEKWDLCPGCWSDYNAFVATSLTGKEVLAQQVQAFCDSIGVTLLPWQQQFLWHYWEIGNHDGTQGETSACGTTAAGRGETENQE